MADETDPHEMNISYFILPVEADGDEGMHIILSGDRPYLAVEAYTPDEIRRLRDEWEPEVLAHAGLLAEEHLQTTDEIVIAHYNKTDLEGLVGVLEGLLSALRSGEESK